MTTILGISAFYHDSAAALVKDGEIVAAAQEERFTRKRHDEIFPRQSVEYCLRQAGIVLTDIDYITFYDKPLLKFERLLESYLASAPSGFGSFIKSMPVWIKEKLNQKALLRKHLMAIGNCKKEQLPPLLFNEHHRSHAASAFFASPFDRAAVLCLDGVGEWATSSIWQGNGNQLELLQEIHFPHSLGLLYSAFTYFCGFKVNSGEYKLMGLAPYGKPVYSQCILENLVDLKSDGSFRLNMDYFDYVTGLRMTNKKFADLFNGPARCEDQPVTQREMDLASSIQWVTEEIVLKIAKHIHETTNNRFLCLAGGVALNCVANGRVLRESAFDSIWLQPAAGDAGGALGAALTTWYQYLEQPRDSFKNDSIKNDSMQGAYLGPEYSMAEIESVLDSLKLPHQYLDDAKLYLHSAELLQQGKVVGWFQGRMEFGPRALGNRSILGDPRSHDMQKTMNLKIKERESFRPFAPSVLMEDVSDFFEQSVESPYMQIVALIRPHLRLSVDENLQGIERVNQIRSQLPSITHVDYSARIQTVHQETNPRYHKLISAFKALTGVPVLINTSFNVRGEPIVCTPYDAVQCFLRTEMDYLVIGNFVLDKTAQSQQLIDHAKTKQFEKD
jgi:carbamoyltransferase